MSSFLTIELDTILIFILCNFHRFSTFSLPHMLPLNYYPLVHKIQAWLFSLYACKKSVCFCWVPNHERVNSLTHSTTLSLPIVCFVTISAIPFAFYCNSTIQPLMSGKLYFGTAPRFWGLKVKIDMAGHIMHQKGDRSMNKVTKWQPRNGKRRQIK